MIFTFTVASGKGFGAAWEVLEVQGEWGPEERGGVEGGLRAILVGVPSGQEGTTTRRQSPLLLGALIVVAEGRPIAPPLPRASGGSILRWLVLV